MTSSDTAQARIRTLIASEHDDGGATGTAGYLNRLCRAAARELPADGVGVSVLTEAGAQGTAAASDARSRVIEDLQITFGEGPCLDAFALRHAVMATDLDGPETRWPAYSHAALDHGVRAVFAFPLQLGAVRMGAVDVYRNQPGALSPEALSVARTFADVALASLLDGQEAAGSTATDAGLDDALSHRTELYQAQGMVMVQLGVPLSTAMSRLRAYAYAHDLPLGNVARDIVARRLTLEKDS